MTIFGNRGALMQRSNKTNGKRLFRTQGQREPRAGAALQARRWLRDFPFRNRYPKTDRRVSVWGNWTTMGLAAMATSMICGANNALAIDYVVYSPLVVRGEKEMEYRSYYHLDNRPEINGQQGYRVAVGAGLTDFWYSDIYGNFSKGYGGGLKAQGVEWENRFQLAPQGKYWLDMGFLSEIEYRFQANAPYEVSVGPLLEKQIGRTVTTLNLLLEKTFGNNANSGVEFEYKARLRYLLKRAFSPAVEAYGSPGYIGRFAPVAAQRHQIGPALYGTLRTGPSQVFSYSGAALFGLTKASPDLTLVLRMEYEFY